MSSTFRTVLVAESLARRGWPVLPCHHPTDDGGCSCGQSSCSSVGKHPQTRRGLHDATVDLDVVRRWWRSSPTANVAVRTGARPTGAGAVVIDIDAGGDTTLADLESRHGPLPVTLEATTGGGGRHLYFAYPGGPIPNSAGRLGPGIDVRGDAGYVLVPPSRHRTGGQYRWKQAPIAELPGWLAELIRPPEPETPIRPRRLRDVTAWAATALAREVTDVRRGAEGTRNHTLNRAAYSLGQLVGAGHLDTADVTERLTHAALAAGLTTRETRATIASGLRAGAAHPRHPVSSR